MRTSRFKSEEVVSLLEQLESGTPVREICIQHGLSETTLYRWKEYYEGLGPNGIRRMRELVQENSRLRSVLSVREIEIDELRAELVRASFLGRNSEKILEESGVESALSNREESFSQ
jgi:putative transposase